MADTPALSIVVPVYNGAATIGELVNALRALEIAGGLEIVLVVDGSPDNSLEVCKQLAAEPGVPIVLLSLSRNFGEHNAVMAGLARARGSYIITMADDLQNPPEEVTPVPGMRAVALRHSLHTTRRSNMPPGATGGGRFTQLGADRLIERPRGSLQLPLSRIRAGRIVASYETLPTSTGGFPGDRSVGRLQVGHLPRFEGRSELHAASARSPLASCSSISRYRCVSPPVQVGLALGALAAIIVLPGRSRTAGRRRAGLMMVAVLVLAGVQLVLVNVIGEYRARRSSP
jgi:undecaprenyl-phosphate 4-deoxy-4-formamido-L-arabinose transferase